MNEVYRNDRYKVIYMGFHNWYCIYRIADGVCCTERKGRDAAIKEADYLLSLNKWGEEQDAIKDLQDILKKQCDTAPYDYCLGTDDCDECRAKTIILHGYRKINNIQQEKKGEWIYTEKGCVITCSCCGERLELCAPDGTEIRWSKHCPSCGAKMKEV